jgi:3-deoxy-manno-octulosonate cytidylyltransferase (CMP-KDO synthetase)
MKIIAVLPFRLKSARIPEKIFHKINGVELCVRTVKQTLKTKMPDLVVIAAVDDEKTFKVLSQVLPENQIIMTDPELPSGTDRVYAAAKIYAAANNVSFQDIHAVVNVQGDMPFLSPTAFEKFLHRITSWKPSEEKIFTPYESWPEDADEKDLGNVKIACDAQDKALYFSRYPIPCSREHDKKALKMHVGIYAYTPAALEKFCKSPVSQLEKLEGLEQLRALNVGIPIYCAHVECQKGESFRGIDTPGDLDWAESFSKIS